MKNLAKTAAIVVFIASLTSCDWINKPKTEVVEKIDTNTTVIEETPIKEVIDTTAAAKVTVTEKTETPAAQPAK